MSTGKQITLSLEDAQAIQDAFECNHLPHFWTPSMDKAVKSLYSEITKAEESFEEEIQESKK